MAFVHEVRPRYAEVDAQGVVFNAHWLTYFDDSCTRFMTGLGFGPGFWIKEFDVMLVKAVVEWVGPAGFDEWIDIEVAPKVSPFHGSANELHEQFAPFAFQLQDLVPDHALYVVELEQPGCYRASSRQPRTLRPSEPIPR